MNSVSLLVKQLIFLLLVAVASLLPALALYLDIVYFAHGVTEYSITEYLQEFCILIALLSALRWLKVPESRGFYVLVAGFFLVLLIREFDMFLDAIRHGFWKYPAILVALFAIYKARQLKGTVLEPMTQFLSAPSGVYISLGLVTVLFFSRLFGTSNLWEPLMGAHFHSDYKAAIQEGAELYGYLLIALGSIGGHLSFFRR